MVKMNCKFKNEILIEGYLFDKDLENKCFRVQCNSDVIEFKYNNDFKVRLLENLKGNEIFLVKGALDQDDFGTFYLAKDIIIEPYIREGE